MSLIKVAKKTLYAGLASGSRFDQINSNFSADLPRRSEVLKPRLDVNPMGRLSHMVEDSNIQYSHNLFRQSHFSSVQNLLRVFFIQCASKAVFSKFDTEWSTKE